REQQRANVGSVHIGVGHEDNLVVTELIRIEFLTSATGAERRNQRRDRFAREHLVKSRALDIQDLAAQREDRLVVAVARLLGAAAGAVAFDDKDLALGGIALLAVCELAGKRAAIEHTL